MRVGASATNAGLIQIEDQSGRRLKVTSAGDGTLFGTDAVNNGGLLANETVRNNLTLHGIHTSLYQTLQAESALDGLVRSNSQVYSIVTDSQTGV